MRRRPTAEAMNTTRSDRLVGILRNTIIALVRRPGPDLTTRQLGVFLTCYLEAEAQTVRGLSAELRISKPSISRSLDRLTEFGLIRRKRDRSDRRSVLVQRTPKGKTFFRDLTMILADAVTEVRQEPSVSPL